jgi:hypothetical protein
MARKTYKHIDTSWQQRIARAVKIMKKQAKAQERKQR